MTVLAKLNETDAPANSCPGMSKEGAVKWLLLKDTKGLSQGGINTVYRIETAGGNKPATCKGQKQTFEVKYSAQCKSSPRYPPFDIGLTFVQTGSLAPKAPATTSPPRVLGRSTARWRTLDAMHVSATRRTSLSETAHTLEHFV
jgi:hypothetical protein